MEGIRLDQFLNYQFLSGLKYSPNGKRAAFVKTQCDEKEKVICLMPVRYGLFPSCRFL